MDYELKSLGDIGKADTSLAMATVRGEQELPKDMDKATRTMIEEIIEMTKGNKR